LAHKKREIEIKSAEKALPNNDRPIISPEWTAAGFWFRNLLDTAAGLGCDRKQLLEELGLTPSFFSNLEKHHPLADLIKLFQMISDRCQEPDIGIRYILNGHPCSLGLLGMAVYTAPTLREAWETVFRFRHLVMNTGNSQFLNEGSTACIRWYPYSHSIVTERFFVDAVLAGWVLNSKALTGKVIQPLSVSVTYAKPVMSELFVETYGTRVSFDQPYNSISFRAEDMDLPLHFSDNKTHRLLCTQAEQDVAYFKAECPFSEKLEYHLKQQLAKGEVSIQAIAELMHISTRTVQRRLDKENTSFHELLTNVRHEFALIYLQEKNLTTLDIALKLGYSQASSFCTAFKSWAGQTPSEYRGIEDLEIINAHSRD